MDSDGDYIEKSIDDDRLDAGLVNEIAVVDDRYLRTIEDSYKDSLREYKTDFVYATDTIAVTLYYTRVNNTTRRISFLGIAKETEMMFDKANEVRKWDGANPKYSHYDELMLEEISYVHEALCKYGEG
ncbi:hypothetical protein DICVIV_07795 [Dictyocaulus viviparus]|uniref:Uncharacterized protein n=1 Tax=Dictyocaulus viviparus TaxID=29172 RepID=A0A0D8XQU3_DICVI|nr:hypothetical protein DICVIV_07795 [Dictyocaulus viviparus]